MAVVLRKVYEVMEMGLSCWWLREYVGCTVDVCWGMGVVLWVFAG